jgi:acyl carrier protein
MELTTIVVVLQDEFGIRIDEDDFSQLTTLAKIDGHVKTLKAS